MNTWRQDGSYPPNLPKLFHSFSYPKKMDPYTPAKTTDISIPTLFEMCILCCSSQNSSTTWRMPPFSWNSTSGGAITTSAFVKKTNGKPPLSLPLDSSNQQWCSSGFAMHHLHFKPLLLWFSSWIALFSSSLPFMPHLLSRDPFSMLTIIIFLSWDPSHSLYMPSNPYAIPYTTTRQGALFAYLFLVMDDYSFSWFSHICCMLFLLILLFMTFHDVPFLLSRTFYLVLSCSFAYSADLLSSI